MNGHFIYHRHDVSLLEFASTIRVLFIPVPDDGIKPKPVQHEKNKQVSTVRKLKLLIVIYQFAVVILFLTQRFMLNLCFYITKEPE